MKKAKYTVALCALLLPGITMAAGFTWVNWTGNQDWADGGNWNQAAAVPSAADETHINQGAGVPGPIVSTPGAITGKLVMDNVSTLSVATGGDLTVSGQSMMGNGPASINNAISVDGGLLTVATEFGVGMTGGASVTVNSGTLNANGGWMIAGYGAGGTGDVIVNGGTLNANVIYAGLDGLGNLAVNGGAANIAGVLIVAHNAGAAGSGVSVDGGVLNVAGLNLGATGGSAGIVNMTGGQLINTGGFVQNAGSVFNIGAGELIFNNGLTLADVNWAIDNGGGTWNFAGANGNVRSVTDDGLGNITVTAIPEPATMGLVALFGGAVLAYRRFFR